VCSYGFAGDTTPGHTAPKISAALEQIKSLEGKWQGTSSGHGKEGEPASVEYRVTSGGTAVEEKLGPGTPHEMVSMYHDVNGRLTMTHYCMLGNQPQLEDKGSGAGKVVLGETDASKALLGGQMRMGSLTIDWTDEDTIVQTWGGQDAEGKPQGPTILMLKRVSQ
jgi:hypothetical protein